MKKLFILLTVSAFTFGVAALHAGSVETHFAADRSNERTPLQIKP